MLFIASKPTCILISCCCGRWYRRDCPKRVYRANAPIVLLRFLLTTCQYLKIPSHGFPASTSESVIVKDPVIIKYYCAVGHGQRPRRPQRLSVNMPPLKMQRHKSINIAQEDHYEVGITLFKLLPGHCLQS